MFFKLFISNFSLLIQKVQNYSHTLPGLKFRVLSKNWPFSIQFC